MMGVWSFCSALGQVLGVQSGSQCSFLPHPHQLRKPVSARVRGCVRKTLSSSLLLPRAHQHSIVSLKETDFPYISVSMAVSPVTPHATDLRHHNRVPCGGADGSRGPKANSRSWLEACGLEAREAKEVTRWMPLPLGGWWNAPLPRKTVPW